MFGRIFFYECLDIEVVYSVGLALAKPGKTGLYFIHFFTLLEQILGLGGFMSVTVPHEKVVHQGFPALHLRLLSLRHDFGLKSLVR